MRCPSQSWNKLLRLFLQGSARAKVLGEEDTDKISALAAHVLQVEWIQPSGFHRFQELQEDLIIQGQRDLCGIPLKVHLPEDKCFFLFFTH